MVTTTIIPEPKFLASPSEKPRRARVRKIIPEPKFLASPSKRVRTRGLPIIPEPKFLVNLRVAINV